VTQLGLSSTDLGKPAFLAALDREPIEGLLPLATRLLAMDPNHAVADGVADVVARRLRSDRESVARWVEDHAKESEPGWAWVRARLLTWLGSAGAAAKAWDHVVDRGIGPRPARHLARARLRLEAGDPSGAGTDVREALRDPASYDDMERACRLLRKIPADQRACIRRLRIAVLGNFTTKLLVPMLELACFRDGIAAEIYESEYGMLHQEVLDPASAMRRFAPEVVIVATTWRESGLPSLQTDPDEALEALLAPYRAIWRVCREELHCPVLQHNFDVPAVESGGHLSHGLAGGRARLLLRANLALLEASAPGFVVVDVDGVAAELGKRQFDDPGLWYLAKQFPAPAAIPLLVDRYAAHLRAIVGLARKVLVLDLDNTLWGGVVGEDGVHGLKLGAHSPEGEAYAAIQRYALELKRRGVVLAVCSKNNDADAREPFEKHPEMVLRLDDIAAFRANWDDKATNLREIAQTLDLGLDSFVFLDDNPTERAWVRSQLPEVAVPEIGDDASQFLARLDRHRYFDAVWLTDEDRSRAEDYAANARRAELRGQVTDMEEFLRGLDMWATVGGFDAANLPRIAQLVNKTNQFNLTTRRYTEDQLRELAASDDAVGRWFRLRDRFSDNGLIGVVLGRLDRSAAELTIDLWLMSCRVLGRRMEEFMLSELVGAARSAGMKRLVGHYLPTQKNAMVRDLYGRMGFRLVEGDASEGPTAWHLDVDSAPEPPALVKRESARVDRDG
jgi:FkbH-like protein